jgi:2-polyprenyl-3-methyl-5-hydroxy-6-metoxy-1,4-benzoquinol methylase
VLDLGCGPGQHARFLAERGYQVVGIDASASMIDMAREDPVPSAVTFIEGDISRVDELVEGEFGAPSVSATPCRTSERPRRCRAF